MKAKRVYMLCSALLAILMLLTCAACGKKEQTASTKNGEILPEVSAQPDAKEEDKETLNEKKPDETTQGKYCKAVLYYMDSSGYTVPVMRKILYKEGIGKASLECLVAGDTAADETLSTKGLVAPLPKGTQIDLDISKGVATVNIIFASAKPRSAEEEQALLASVVNTLFEFPTVQQVMIMINGRNVDVMDNGTRIQSMYKGPIENCEPTLSADVAGKYELFFTNETGKVIIPVFRTMEDPAPMDVVNAMMHADNAESVFPAGCEVYSVSVENGCAIVDLSEEFAALAEQPSREFMAAKCLSLALRKLEGIKEVKLQVEGKDYDFDVATTSAGDNGYINLFS